MFHRKERNASAVARAKRMHDECMKDPEYAAKWSALTYALAPLLTDLPDEATCREPR